MEKKWFKSIFFKGYPIPDEKGGWAIGTPIPEQEKPVVIGTPIPTPGELVPNHTGGDQIIEKDWRDFILTNQDKSFADYKGDLNKGDQVDLSKFKNRKKISTTLILKLVGPCLLI